MSGANIAPFHTHSQKIQVGQGYQKFSGRSINTGLKLKTDEVIDPSFKFTALFCDTMLELQRNLNISVGLSGTVPAYDIGVSMGASYQSSSKTTTIAGYYLLEFTWIKKFEEATDLQDAPEKVVKLIKAGPDGDTQKFYENFGDAFISRVDYGQKLIAIVEVYGKETSKLTQMAANLGLSFSVPGAVTLTGAATQKPSSDTSQDITTTKDAEKKNNLISIERLLQVLQSEKQTKTQILAIGINSEDLQKKFIQSMVDLRKDIASLISTAPTADSSKSAVVSSPASGSATSSKDDTKTVISFVSTPYTALLSAEERERTKAAFQGLRKSFNFSKQFTKQIFVCRNRLQHYLNLLQYALHNGDVVQMNAQKEAELNRKLTEIKGYIARLEGYQKQIKEFLFHDRAFSLFDVPLGIASGRVKSALQAAQSAADELRGEYTDKMSDVDFLLHFDRIATPFDRAVKAAKELNDLATALKTRADDQKKAANTAKTNADTSKKTATAALQSAKKEQETAQAEYEEAQKKSKEIEENKKVTAAYQVVIETIILGLLDRKTSEQSSNPLTPQIYAALFKTAKAKCEETLKTFSTSMQMVFHTKINELYDQMLPVTDAKKALEVVGVGLKPAKADSEKSVDAEADLKTKQALYQKALHEEAVAKANQQEAEQTAKQADDSAQKLEMITQELGKIKLQNIETQSLDLCTDLNKVRKDKKFESSDARKTIKGKIDKIFPNAGPSDAIKSLQETLDLHDDLEFSWGRIARDITALTDAINSFSTEIIDFQNSAILVGTLVCRNPDKFAWHDKSDYQDLVVPFETRELIFDVAHNSLKFDQEPCGFTLYRKHGIATAGREHSHKKLYEKLEHRAHRQLLSLDLAHTLMHKMDSKFLAGLGSNYEKKMYHQVYIETEKDPKGYAKAPVRNFKLRAPDQSAQAEQVIVRVFAQIGPAFEPLESLPFEQLKNIEKTKYWKTDYEPQRFLVMQQQVAWEDRESKK